MTTSAVDEVKSRRKPIIQAGKSLLHVLTLSLIIVLVRRFQRTYFKL